MKVRKAPTPCRCTLGAVAAGLVMAGLVSFFEGFRQSALLRAGTLGLATSLLFSALFFGRHAMLAHQVICVLARSFLPDIAADLRSELAKIDSLEVRHGKKPRRHKR